MQKNSTSLFISHSGKAIAVPRKLDLSLLPTSQVSVSAGAASGGLGSQLVAHAASRWFLSNVILQYHVVTTTTNVPCLLFSIQPLSRYEEK